MSNPEEQWYINDHCFVVDPDEVIHWFGITNPYPQQGGFYGPGTHRHIGHASARDPFGPWQEHIDAFSLPEGSADNIGASFVVRQGDRYVMIYGYNAGFAIARSEDLYDWQVIEGLDKVWLGKGTRDPCVVHLDDGTYLLYGAAGHRGSGSVVLASSSDLLHWHPEPPALQSDVPGDWGPLESPFVLCHQDWFYLFVNHSHHQYEETLVFASRDPCHFEWSQPVCTLFGHACELFTWGGATYVSHCGIEDRHWSDTAAPYGLYLAEMGWLEGKSKGIPT